jgi:hypothetical protein
MRISFLNSSRVKHVNEPLQSRAQWLMTVIPGTWEMETGLWFQVSLSKKTNKQTNKQKTTKKPPRAYLKEQARYSGEYL